MTPRSPSRPVRTLVLIAVLLLAATACGGGDASDGDDTTTTAPPPATTDQDGGTDDSTAPPDSMPPEGAPPGSQADQAVADLADRLGVDPGAITVVSHEAVTWPDGSLGCPQPDMGYTQALVEGTRTLLEVEGETYSYHAEGMGVPFLCENPQPGVGET